ncbi:MAG TPA: acetate kinase [Clostridiales bacterium]|jgi:acetate kinase|nr:acetate kinase [Clostridiales bacterium]
MKVLVVNAGSSSLKYQLIDSDTEVVFARGICERIGQEGSEIDHRQLIKGVRYQKEMPMSNHADAMRIVVDMLTDPAFGCIGSMAEIDAVGHRVVHGGPFFVESVLVSPEVIKELEGCRDFAPLHTEAHLMGIKACLEVMPQVPEVLVFDTAFHRTMPEEAYFYPVSYDMYEKYKIRRYGAHGTSHRYVSGVMQDILAKAGKTKDTKIVTCHLGNGSSISAIRDGKVIDTSMGFTPLDGIEMGTRCGSIDPAIVTYIMDKKGFTPDRMNEYMNKECGFLGITGYNDARDIERAILAGPNAPPDPDNPRPDYYRARLCFSILHYQIKKYIGAYAAAMNGLDAIVFTAGIGENNPRLREEVCSGLSFLGIEIDKEANDRAVRQPNVLKLSTDTSKVFVYMIPTNEEIVIARDTAKIVSELGKK